MDSILQKKMGSAEKLLSKLNSTLNSELDSSNISNSQIYPQTSLISDRKENTLDLLKELQEIISGDTTLSQEEKAEFCKSQRYFMKLYLKKLNGIR